MRTLRQQLEDKALETGEAGWLLRQARRAEKRQRAITQPWQADFRLDAEALVDVGDGRPMDLRGASARIDTAGEIRRRVTVTRAATMGVFALAARKKVDDEVVYLTIEGPHVAEVREYPAKNLDQAALRQFVADINSLAARSST